MCMNLHQGWLNSNAAAAWEPDPYLNKREKNLITDLQYWLGDSLV